MFCTSWSTLFSFQALEAAEQAVEATESKVDEPSATAKPEVPKIQESTASEKSTEGKKSTADTPKVRMLLCQNFENVLSAYFKGQNSLKTKTWYAWQQLFLTKTSVDKSFVIVVKLPPRPADYDYYWYEDDDGNWRNEYDDMGYEFDPERWDVFSSFLCPKFCSLQHTWFKVDG